MIPIIFGFLFLYFASWNLMRKEWVGAVGWTIIGMTILIGHEHFNMPY